MKTLVLITSNYPFGTSEPFPDEELPYHQKEFSKIIIIAQNTRDEQTHILSPEIKIYRYNTTTSFTGFLKLPFLLLKNLCTITRMFKEETGFRRDHGFNLKTNQRSFLTKKIIKAVQLSDYIKSVLSKENIASEIVFYSYWLNSGAHAIGMLDYEKSIKISRAHGSDLYEEKTERGYLPLLRFVSERLDSVFFISEHGKNFFSSKTGTCKAQLKVSRLGMNRPEFPEDISSGISGFIIVSCSNLVPLKRINLIIEALNLLQTEREVFWVHFGSGILGNVLKRMASETIGSSKKIRYEFRGYIPADEILRYYSRNRINLFLNTSSTEGVPVSIMEAQSFGIPVIATNVGGVSEIVTEGTGFLLPADFKPEELADKIKLFMNMKPEEESRFCERAFASWNQKFNAAVNYPEFISIVNSIFEKSIKEND